MSTISSFQPPLPPLNADGTRGTVDTTSAATGTSATNSLSGLDTNAFLKLMITQLQNQDPMNPTDNNQMLQQISQIRDIGTMDELSKSLTTVASGQNLTSAISLVGKQINGLSDSNQTINAGTIDSVTVIGGVPKLNIGNQTVSLNNVKDVLTDNNSQTNQTLIKMLSEQNVMSALSLIGKQIKGIANDQTDITGVVDSVTVANGVPTLHLGNRTVTLNNITDVLAAPSSTNSGSTGDNSSGTSSSGTGSSGSGSSTGN